MTFNLKEVLKTSELSSEKLADDFMEELNKLNLFRLHEINISFKGIKSVSQAFANKFVRYLAVASEQDTENIIHIRLKDIDQSYRHILDDALSMYKSNS